MLSLSNSRFDSPRIAGRQRPAIYALPVLLAIPLVLSSLLLTGCERDFGPEGAARTDMRDIELDQSEEVRVDLRFGAGELRVRGGANKLMEGQFRYSRLRGRPEISYDSTGSRGHLSIEQPAHFGGTSHGYTWDLRLNDSKPFDINVKCGAGETRLDLQDLTLRRVNVEMGVGELKLDLRGQPKNDYDVSIRGGVGEATVYLPEGVGIEADVKGGIGDIHARGLDKRNGRYVNDAYGRATTTVHLDVRGGIGQINLIAN